jgi:hypothetical protein
MPHDGCLPSVSRWRKGVRSRLLQSESREEPYVKPSLEELYSRHIRPLSVEDRLSLLAAMAHDLKSSLRSDTPGRSLLELEGLGAEIWREVDPQAYVEELRAEWDHRP